MAMETPLDRLRKKLKQGKPLPKDDTYGAKRGKFHRFLFRDKKAERTLLRRLLAPGRALHDGQLGVKIAYCHHIKGREHWICYICRDQHYQQVRRDVDVACRNADPATEISFLTIIAGCTYAGQKAVRKRIEATIKGVEDVFSKWPQIKAHGRFEVDMITPGATPTTAKLATLEGLGYTPDKLDKVGYIPHLHAIVVHPGLSRRAIAYHLSRKFSVLWRVNLGEKRAAI